MHDAPPRRFSACMGRDAAVAINWRGLHQPLVTAMPQAPRPCPLALLSDSPESKVRSCPMLPIQGPPWRLALRLLAVLCLFACPRIGSTAGTWSVISLPQQPGEVVSPSAVTAD